MNFINFFAFFRDLRESRQRNEALAIDLKRKEKQIKDLQNRVDSDGCKFPFKILIYFFISFTFMFHFVFS